MDVFNVGKYILKTRFSWISKLKPLSMSWKMSVRKYWFGHCQNQYTSNISITTNRMSTNITRITMSTEKLEVLPVANNTAEVRHEYLAKFDFDHFSPFPPMSASYECLLWVPGQIWLFSLSSSSCPQSFLRTMPQSTTRGRRQKIRICLEIYFKWKCHMRFKFYRLKIYVERDIVQNIYFIIRI